MGAIADTDLILNPDGSIYHLHLLPEDIADTILMVGDPGRVRQVSTQFDHLEIEKSNREFVTHTGTVAGKRLSVVSTGIGTDNIDIVLNELDAIANIDLETRSPKVTRKRLKLIRLGTSGALHEDIAPGAVVVTKVAGGLDGLYHFYQDDDGITVPGLAETFMRFTGWKKSLAEPYFVKGSDRLIDLLAEADQFTGITLSTPGFYAPQGRSIRLTPFEKTLIEKIGSFSFNGMRINNFEMESSALYALSALMGHEAITICIAVANRVSGVFLDSYHSAIDQLITMVLGKLALDDNT